MLSASSCKQLLLLGLCAVAQAKTKFLGVAMAGIDFECDIQGNCPSTGVTVPLTAYGGGDSAGFMKHFAEDDGVNLFRLPVTWQFLVASDTVGTINADNLAAYDELVQACLATGAYCMIDLHNFAHFEGDIIGQGGPSNTEFAALWTTLATKYAKQTRIIFEIMNEPHHLDVDAWVTTCQAAVTAIRKAGASSQMILLPGTNFDSAATIYTDGSADAVLGVTNPDGTTTNLLLDVHKYLDSDNSGESSICTMNNVAAFNGLAAYLRKKGRQALVSETGASSDSSCMTYFKEQNVAINENSDVFVGIVGWGAGNFKTSYVLSLVPTKSSSGSYVDNDVMTECLLGPWLNGSAVTPLGGTSTSTSTTKTKTKTATTKTTKTTKTTATSTLSTSTSASVSASSNSTSTQASSTLVLAAATSVSLPSTTSTSVATASAKKSGASPAWTVSWPGSASNTMAMAQLAGMVTLALAVLL